jgi:hypothetical protein
MKTPSRPLRASLCVIATLLLAACESHPDRHAMMEESRHPVPPMAANEPFFDGTVIAHLTLGSVAGGSSGSGDDSDSGSGHSGGGSGGGRHSHGGGGGYGGGGGGGGGRHQGGSQSSDSSGEDAPSPTMRASNLPPAMLRLRLENTGAATVDVEVRDLNSDLGDFAVRPDKLTIEPGQSAEPDPMESLLGLDTYALPVTITLRSGGKTETKVLTLQLVKPAPTPASAPAADAPPPKPAT